MNLSTAPDDVLLSVHSEMVYLEEGVAHGEESPWPSTDNACYLGVPMDAADTQEYMRPDDESGVEVGREDQPSPPDNEEGGKQGKVLQRICDIINIIASKGESLEFDHATKVFRVVDGKQFENDFVSLKVTKTTKESGRIFAQMYRTYAITHGDRWAADGTEFVAKSHTTPLPVRRRVLSHGMAQTSSGPSHPGDHTSPSSRPDYAVESALSDRSSPSKSQPSMTLADSVYVQLTDVHGRKEACTLQRFVDVTGLANIYRAAVSSRKRVREEGGDLAAADDHANTWWASEASAARPQPLRHAQVPQVMGGLWSATSKGDQAYFFKRTDGVGAFENGAIVGLVGGVLQDAAAVQHGGGKGLYMVVSDLNAKWKGEPIPVTAAEEARGHWCCFLGQVPVTVVGPVKTGQCIGPAEDGGGLGRVAVMGKEPVVGIALVDKADAGPGLVKTLCFAGLNALSQNDDVAASLVEKAVRLEQRVEELHDRADHIEASDDKNRRRLSSLSRVMNAISRSKRLQLRISAIVLLVVIVVGVTLALTLRGGLGNNDEGRLPGVPPSSAPEQQEGVPVDGVMIDECASGTHACASNEDCATLDGGYSCSCKRGFRRGCSDGWTLYGDQCYYHHIDRPMTYPEAAGMCASLGGALPIVASQAENDFVRVLACGGAVDDTCEIWLGMERADRGGGWLWRDGTEVVVPSSLVFTHSSLSHARIVSSGADWADDAATSLNQVVCEREMSPESRCVDVDECANPDPPCAVDHGCHNTEGSFSCFCPDGFTGDGFTCVDTDECTAASRTVAALQWRVANLGDCGARPVVSELKMFGGANGEVELRSYQEVISSGFFEPAGMNASAAAAVDGDPASNWRPHIEQPLARQVWIGFRFATPTVVHRAHAVGLGIAEFPAQRIQWNGGVALEFSNDGVVWSTAASQDNSDAVASNGSVAVQSCSPAASCTNTEGSFVCDCGPGNINGCRDGFRQLGMKCWKAVETSASYQDARAACTAAGAALPIIGSKAENDNVYYFACGSAIDAGDICEIWLGMQKEADGTWWWRDGTEAVAPSDVKVSFSSHSHARIVSEAVWADASPSDRIVAVCERPFVMAENCAEVTLGIGI